MTDTAFKWFKDEMDVENGDSIKFFARYGGASPLHEAFSLGVMKEKPDLVSTETIISEIQFYVEQRDEWFFDGHDLHVSFDSVSEELVYSYKKT